MPTIQDGIRGLNEADGTLANLRFSLQLLAAPGSEQISHFALPDFPYKAEELASDYIHWASCIATYVTLTSRQTELLSTLDEFLGTADRGDGAAFWRDQALRDHPNWEQARVMAKTALASFGWKAEVPPQEELVKDRCCWGE